MELARTLMFVPGHRQRGTPERRDLGRHDRLEVWSLSTTILNAGRGCGRHHLSPNLTPHRSLLNGSTDTNRPHERMANVQRGTPCSHKPLPYPNPSIWLRAQYRSPVSRREGFYAAESFNW